jgi:hypothetical protein
VFTKSHIIEEIKRTARENRGSPLGIARFEAETGIKSSDWMGKFWPRWGDALAEAGFQPNILQGPRNEDELLERLATLARELGHFPVANELKLKARTEPGFPWHNSLRVSAQNVRWQPGYASSLRHMGMEISLCSVTL